MQDLLFIILILVVAWYWWDTQQCNEIALATCKLKCESAGFQLLDATVIRQRMWLRKGSLGIQICRFYSFDYDGAEPSGAEVSVFARQEFGQRQQGYIVLIGKQVVETKLPHADAERENE